MKAHFGQTKPGEKIVSYTVYFSKLSRMFMSPTLNTKYKYSHTLDNIYDDNDPSRL